MPFVAFESTVFAHGLPSPIGLETAFQLEEIAREEGVTPKTIGIVSGKPIVGLSRAEIEYLATSDSVRKASVRDVSVVTALGLDAATTVAGTVTCSDPGDACLFGSKGDSRPSGHTRAPRINRGDRGRISDG